MLSLQNTIQRSRASLQHARCWCCAAGIACLLATAGPAFAQSTAQSPPPLTEMRSSVIQSPNFAPIAAPSAGQAPSTFMPLPAPKSSEPNSAAQSDKSFSATSSPQLRISPPSNSLAPSTNGQSQPLNLQPIAAQPPAMPARTMNVTVSQPASVQSSNVLNKPADGTNQSSPRSTAPTMQVAITPDLRKPINSTAPQTSLPKTPRAPSNQYYTLSSPPAIGNQVAARAQTPANVTPVSASTSILQPPPVQTQPVQTQPAQQLAITEPAATSTYSTQLPEPQPVISWTLPQNSPTAQAARLRANQIEQLQLANLNNAEPQLLLAQSSALPVPTQPPVGGIDPQTPPSFGPGSVDFGQSFFNQPGATRSTGNGAVSGQTPAQSTLEVPAPTPVPQQYPATMPSLAVDPVQQPVQNSTQQLAPTPLVIETPSQMTVVTQPPMEFNLGADPSSPLSANTTGTSWVFNFQEAPWSIVLKNFARHSGMSLQIEQFPPGTLSYYDDRAYEFTEALDVINDHLLAQGFLLVRNENKLTSLSTSNPLREGVVPFVPLRSVAILGRNELVSVAFPIANGAGLQAVPEVQQLLSPVGKVQALSNSNRLIVTDTGASLRRLRDLLSGSGLAGNDVEQFVIHLRNTKAEEVASSINQRLNRTGTSPATGGVVQASATSPVGPLVSMAVVPEKQTNSLLVEGTPEEFARIEALVRMVDRDPAQVVIQALLVEVELGNSRETGLELGFQDSVLFDRSVIDNLVSVTQTATAANGVQTTNQNVVSQTSSPGFNFNGSPLGNNTTVRPSTVGKQSTTNLGLGRVSSDLGFGGLVLSAGSNSVNVLLRALAENHKLDVLSRPQVRTLNNREALIQIGQQVPIVEGVSVTTNGNANPIIRQDKAGIILRVTPRIADDGLVQIDVHAEKSAYNLTPGSGVPIFTDATRGNVVEAPVKDITTAETTVSAFSGQTVVLGGMITRDQTEVHRRVPFLSDIPLLGRLFRVDLSRTNRKELLIFLTPVVVNSAGESDCIAAEEASRMHVTIDPNVDLHRDFLQVLDTEKVQPAFPTTEVLGPGLFEVPQ